VQGRCAITGARRHLGMRLRRAWDAVQLLTVTIDVGVAVTLVGAPERMPVEVSRLRPLGGWGDTAKVITGPPPIVGVSSAAGPHQRQRGEQHH